MKCPKCPDSYPRHISGNLSTVNEYNKMHVVQEASKVYEAFDIDPTKWSLGFSVKYENQHWNFYLLFKNLEDKAKNFRVFCGRI